MSTDTIASGVSLGISGLFLAVAAVLLVLRLRWRRQMKRCRQSQRHQLSKLLHLTGDDVDPGWPEVWATFPGHANDLTEVPPEWDPCVTSKPHRPEDPPKPRGERKGNDAN